MSDNENEQANEKNEVDGQRPLMLGDGHQPAVLVWLMTRRLMGEERRGKGTWYQESVLRSGLWMGRAIWRRS